MVPSPAQFIGCLVGQALGDALGFVVEGYPPSVCYDYVARLREQPLPQEGRGDFPFGQYTDDTQLARELLHSMTLIGHFEAEDYARRLVAIFRSNRIVGRGKATEESVNRLMQGIPFQQSGAMPGNAGNGSAMRAAPVGLMFYDKPQELVKIARDQGRITHQDERCSAGAVAIASAVALALTSEQVEPQSFCQTLAERVRPLHEGFALSLLKLPAWAKLSPEEALEPISQEGLEKGYQDFWQGISPFVVGSVLWSLFAFLRFPDDYWNAVLVAIQPGGDVDTTAAMTGAISGARLGLYQLPLELAYKVTDQGSWDMDALKALAWQAHSVKHP